MGLTGGIVVLTGRPDLGRVRAPAVGAGPGSTEPWTRQSSQSFSVQFSARLVRLTLNCLWAQLVAGFEQYGFGFSNCLSAEVCLSLELLLTAATCLLC